MIVIQRVMDFVWNRVIAIYVGNSWNETFEVIVDISMNIEKSWLKSEIENFQNYLNVLSFFLFQKLWAVCDLAMGLILSKTTSFEMKEFPSDPRIPPMYFKKHEDPNFVNGE